MTISEIILGKLRAAKAEMLGHPEIREVNEAQDEVIARYGPVFQRGAIENIDENVLRSFLYIENNRHWSGLSRQVNRVCSDMTATRAALGLLVDETRPISERMLPITNIKGMGKGIITAILHVAYPARYGVWNNTSNSGLVALGLMPEFRRGATFGERYAAINSVFVDIASALDVDLWTLDTLWWFLISGDEEGVDNEPLPSGATITGPLSQKAVAKISRFALERHLHDYMFYNWDNLDLSADWTIYSLDGDPEAGYEFPTPVGRIDLLARHRRDGAWLVIELKRDRSSDAVLGQVLRYMGWVQKHVAESGEAVTGLIVATEGDLKLLYALEVAPSVSFKSYEIEFRLKDAPLFEEFAHP